ncbi:hypothetical protein BDZ89DRAFT_1080337 [Hymenopellis radicata]|nr:hypothetical protein BDZ89DRAFT_1080337 [Hymenopellis radicata]
MFPVRKSSLPPKFSHPYGGSAGYIYAYGSDNDHDDADEFPDTPVSNPYSNFRSFAPVMSSYDTLPVLSLPVPSSPPPPSSSGFSSSSETSSAWMRDRKRSLRDLKAYLVPPPREEPMDFIRGFSPAPTRAFSLSTRSLVARKRGWGRRFKMKWANAVREFKRFWIS